MLLPLILSVLAFVECMAGSFRRRLVLMICCGALIGLATAFKQVAAVSWPLVVALYPFWSSEQKTLRWRNTVLFAALSGAGLVLVWGLIVLYFQMRGDPGIPGPGGPSQPKPQAPAGQ